MQLRAFRPSPHTACTNKPLRSDRLPARLFAISTFKIVPKAWARLSAAVRLSKPWLSRASVVNRAA
jgi:hypothetical protein